MIFLDTLKLVKTALDTALRVFNRIQKPLLADFIKQPNQLFGMSVLKNVKKHLEEDSLNRCSTICFDGSKYFIMLMHPRQVYLMDVAEAKMWYQDMMRQIRMLKYFER
jgi:hypothetical protein